MLGGKSRLTARWRENKGRQELGRGPGREREPGLPSPSGDTNPGSFWKEGPCLPYHLWCTPSPPCSCHPCRCPAP